MLVSLRRRCGPPQQRGGCHRRGGGRQSVDRGRVLFAIPFALALFAVGNPAAAEPIGRWWSGWGMGTFEYGYKSAASGGNVVYIACSDSETSIRFSIRGRDPRPRSVVSVAVGRDTFEVITDQWGTGTTESHVAADTFVSLWSAMRAGSSMQVRFSTGETARFTLGGSAEALPKQPCKPDFWR